MSGDDHKIYTLICTYSPQLMLLRCSVKIWIGFYNKKKFGFNFTHKNGHLTFFFRSKYSMLNLIPQWPRKFLDHNSVEITWVFSLKRGWVILSNMGSRYKNRTKHGWFFATHSFTNSTQSYLLRAISFIWLLKTILRTLLKCTFQRERHFISFQ